jgi:hypothetical protein
LFLKRLKITFSLLLLFNGSILYAQSQLKSLQREQQFDENLELAKDEMANGQTTRAMSLLRKNLSKKYFHLDSYLFLANYHFEQKNYTKGFKVYHYTIKKLHSSKIIRSSKISDIESVSSNTKKPSNEALEIYTRLAQKYFELADSDVFSESFSKTLLLRSLKYYKVINYYDYNLAETKYMLAVLQNRLDDFQSSMDNLIDSQDFYLSADQEESNEQIENIKYLMGDNLIRSGFTDAGSLYLKSILLSPNSSQSLKEYASSYLDTLSEDYFSFSVKVAKTYNNNIHLIPDNLLPYWDRFPIVQKVLVSLDGWSDTLAFNVFYNSKKFDHWSFYIYTDMENQTMSRKELSDKDSRTYSSSFEIKYDNFESSLLKFNFSWSYSQYKEAAGSPFVKLSNLYAFSPSYTYMLSKGSLTTKATLSVTNSISEGNLSENAYSLTYQPFYKTPWFSPSFSIEGGQLEEDSTSPVSTKATVTISNLSAISENHSFFLSLDATMNKNEDDDLTYQEYTGSLTHTYLIPWINGLTLNLNVDYEHNKPKDSDPIKVLEYGASLTYNF